MKIGGRHGLTACKRRWTIANPSANLKGRLVTVDESIKSATDNEVNHVWEIYSGHRKSLEEIRIHQINTFDKTIVATSSSALGLSIVLISSFAISGKLVAVAWLVVSWVLFVGTITANLVSYKTSAFAAEALMKRMDEAMLNGELYRGTPGFWGYCTMALNWLTIAGFSSAAFFLLLFALQNASALEANAEQKSPSNTLTIPTDPSHSAGGMEAPTGYVPLNPAVPKPALTKPPATNPQVEPIQPEEK